MDSAMNNSNDILGVEQAAALLRAEASTVMHFARRGDLPGTCIGKSWVFLRDDVMEFLRQQIANDTEKRRRQATKAAVAIAVPAASHSRRSKLPVLPALPVPLPTKKSP